VDGTILSDNNEHVMTHVVGVDFNSLYPSSFSSITNENNPYTDHKMYMPGRVTKFELCDTEEKKDWARNIIARKEDLFIAELKGHIDEEFVGDFVNFPPIFRRVGVQIKPEMIGEMMWQHMVTNGLVNKKRKPRVETKMTQLCSTLGTVMSFSSYYLWFLIDTCHFVIDDIQSLILFEKHDAFKPFVQDMMNKRLVNKDIETFFKTTMNGSYGYDGMNTEKFTRNKICDTNQASILQSHADFVGTPIDIDANTHIVTLDPKSYGCKTPIQCAYFTLDNAKFWYLNFIYNFMYRCLDMDRIHFVEGDTDSAYWAVAGHPKAGKTQQFEYVVKDQAFYDAHYNDWFPDMSKMTWSWKAGGKFIFESLEARQEEKKLLGLAIEKESENMIALSPKCYIPFDGQVTGELEGDIRFDPRNVRMKGVKASINPHFNPQAYFQALMRTPVQGKNIGFKVLGERYQQKIVTVMKNALTGVHTKMQVDANQACLPFLKLV
jgi:hypothetical protein